MAKIIQAEFSSYAEHVYSGLAPGSDQYEQLRGAFFAGARTALHHAEDVENVIDMDLELSNFCEDAPIANRVLSPKAS